MSHARRPVRGAGRASLCRSPCVHPPTQAVQLREITLDGAALVEAQDYTLTDETITLLRPPAGAHAAL